MQDSPWENRQCTGKGIIMAAADIGIDLGTSSILVYTKGKGIVLKEPSVVAYDKDADKVKAIGEEARQMIGRTPGNIMAIRPLRQGVISDYTITEKMLKHFIQKAMGRKAFISTKPYPGYANISLLQNTDEFVTGFVTYRLCKVLSEWLPDPQNRCFISEAARMERDRRGMRRRRERRRAERRRRRMKKREQ